MVLKDKGLSDLEEAYASPILEAKYEKVDVEDLLKEHCSHLNQTQQGQLKEVLLKYDKLFDGVLKNNLDNLCISICNQRLVLCTEDHSQCLRYIWQPSKRN